MNRAVAAEMVVNLIARLYPSVAIVGADTDFVTEMRKLARAINPKIELRDTAEGVAISLIDSQSSNLVSTIFPWSQGWVAGISPGPVTPGSLENAYAATASGVMAVSQLFRATLMSVAKFEAYSWSLLDYSERGGHAVGVPRTTISKATLAGVGAVGNALLWTLARDGTISGELEVVDPEKVELSNLQRYVLTTYKSVGTSKVKLAEQALKAGVMVKPFPQRLDQYAESHPTFPVQTLLVAVDSIEDRRTAQALLPGIVINGWTGDRSLGSSWHVMGNGSACLACLYHPVGQRPSQTAVVADALGLSPHRAAELWVTRGNVTEDDIGAIADHFKIDASLLKDWRKRPIGELYRDLICGSAGIDLRHTGHLEAVPLAHQSAMAGVLAAAEFCKRSSPELSRLSQTEPLVMWDDVTTAAPRTWLRPRPQEQGCICMDPIYSEVFREKWEQAALDLV